MDMGLEADVNHSDMMYIDNALSRRLDGTPTIQTEHEAVSSSMFFLDIRYLDPIRSAGHVALTYIEFVPSVPVPLEQINVHFPVRDLRSHSTQIGKRPDDTFMSVKSVECIELIVPARNASNMLC